MKKLALLILAFGISFTVSAQKQKIAHISTQQIIQDLAIKDSIPAKIQEFAVQLENEFKRMQTKLDSDINQYMQEKDTLPQFVQQSREEELGLRKQKLQQETLPQFQRMAQNKEQELAIPLQEKLVAAIEKISKKEGYTYVIEEAATLYAGGTDITKIVRVELGLPEVSTTPAQPQFPVGQ